MQHYPFSRMSLYMIIKSRDFRRNGNFVTVIKGLATAR